MSNSHSYLFNLVLGVAMPVGGGFDLLFRHNAVWQQAVGALLWFAVALEIVLFIRWWRKPVDPEAFEERNRLRVGWMFDRKQRIPPRSKW
jgi:hypothetical protein